MNIAGSETSLRSLRAGSRVDTIAQATHVAIR